jgi:lysophospholipase L1-like esterase
MQIKMKKVIAFYIVPIFLFSGSMLLCLACKKNNVMLVTTINDTTKHDSITPADTIKTWLALGDSYTIGQSVPESDRYPVQTVELIKAIGINLSKAEIIATTGWTTQNLLDAIKNKSATPSYSIVSLLIGVNNQYQGRSLDEYKRQFTTLLQQSIQFAGNKASHVFVLSVPDYSVTPFARNSDRAKIAAEIDLFNAANKQIADLYKVNYLNITEESRKAATDLSLIASDSLHFSGKEYMTWSVMLAPLIKQALQ